jgi:anthranilate phosphoribosyltransferase
MIREAIQTILAGKHLSRQDAHRTMSGIMSGEATPAQIGAFLVGMRMKGERADEVAGFAEAMREKATRVPTRHENAIDMCGTGGDGAGTFNISTVASFVVAGGGVPVAKHGNRSVSSQCGSADVLQALGVKIDLSAEQMGECLDKLGIAFLFAPTLHPAMKHAIGPRRELGVRTVFNILGPITNPAFVRRQVLGVYNAELARLLAQVLAELDTEHAVIVHGEEGLDEISISGSTLAFEVKRGNVSESRLLPEDFGLRPGTSDGLAGGDAERNAEIAMQVLRGESGPARDAVIANAACGLVVGGAATTFADGAQLARQSIDSGAALAKLEAMIEFTNAA